MVCPITQGDHNEIADLVLALTHPTTNLAGTRGPAASAKTQYSALLIVNCKKEKKQKRKALFTLTAEDQQSIYTEDKMAIMKLCCVPFKS